MKKDMDLKVIQSDEAQNIHALMAMLGHAARKAAHAIALASTD